MLIRLVIFLLLPGLLWGCASVPVQQKGVHGAIIETLQGSVNISLTSPVGRMSGNGFFFYQRPESFRLALLAPFGQSIVDIVVKGEQVTCLMESRKKGWQGRVSDLPDSLGLKIWPLMAWTVEPPHPPGPSLERVFTRPDGSVEKVYYDAAGLVQRKVNSSGDEVLYDEYKVQGNRAVPNRIEIITAEGSRLVLVFDEPQLDVPIDNEIFNPKLDGFEMLPLAGYNGF